MEETLRKEYEAMGIKVKSATQEDVKSLGTSIFIAPKLGKSKSDTLNPSSPPETNRKDLPPENSGQ